METTTTSTETGIQIINPEAIYALAERLNLWWAVKKEHLLLPNGVDSGFYGIVRQDTQEVFASAKETYEVFQNWEMLEIVTRVAESLGTTVARAGMFDGGAKVWVQIERPDWKINGDTVKRWSTSINSFDLTTALRWGTQNLTISCQNTFWASYRSLNTSVKHTRNMRDAVNQSLRALENIEEHDKTLFELFTNMMHTKATEEQTKKVIKLVSGVDTAHSFSQAEKLYSTRKLNIARDVTTSILTELSAKADTLWGLWSGVTHYTTHKASSDNAREKSKLMGSLQRTDERILEEIMGYVQGFAVVNK